MSQKTAQFELNFDAGLTTQFPEYADVLVASTNSGTPPAKIIAADLDLSQSILSRQISPAYTDVNFPAYRLPELIRATGDFRLIYWLVEEFLQDADAQAKQAVSEIAALLPKLQALVERANPDETKLKVAK